MQIIKSFFKVLFLYLLLFSTLSYSQTPEPIVAKVYYKFNYQYDTTSTNFVKKENYLLLLGKSSSVYKSFDKAAQDSEMIANYKKTGTMGPPSGARANSEELYYYLGSKQAYLKVRILGNYAIATPFDEVTWKIDRETKKIADLDCQKATTNFHGRDYIAWFTTSLPFTAGPWKLHGLPGLIISAYDKTGRIRFDFSGFEQVKTSKEETAWDKKATKITWEDYKKIAKAAENDPDGFIGKQFGGKLTTFGPKVHRNILAPSKLINFPLEVVNATSK